MCPKYAQEHIVQLGDTRYSGIFQTMLAMILQMIRLRVKNWINHTCKDNPNRIILVSYMADATKVPTVGEFSHKYNV